MGYLWNHVRLFLTARLKHVPSPLLGVWFGLAIGILSLLLAVTPFGLAWQERLDLAWLFALRGPIAPPRNVVIVGIDKQSANALDLSTLPSEWPRVLHARLIDALMARGARLIAFDINFATQRDEEGDRRLAEAIARSGRVLLLEHLERSRTSPADGHTSSDAGLWIEERRQPLPMFSGAALGTAPFPLPRRPDRVDQFWAYLDRYGGLLTLPTLAAQVAAGGADAAPAEPGRGRRQLLQSQPDPITSLPNSVPDDRAPTRPSSSGRPPMSTPRPLIGLYAGSDTRYLNYFGPPGTIRTISYHSLIAHDPRSDLQGADDLSEAYIFVGYAELQGPNKIDTYDTVFPGLDGVEMSGVEIAATAFANLLSDRTLERPGLGITTAVLLGIAVMAAVVTCPLPPAVGIATTLGLALAYDGAAYLLFAHHDLWLPLAIPNVIELPLAIVFGLLTQYLRARTQREAMRHVANYYVPERVAHEMADHAVSPLSVRGTSFATCLAMDAENFTGLSETLPPDTMATFLNDYFAAVAEPLVRHRADFKEFHADSVMCAWMSDGDDSLVRARACRAALETLDAVNEFNARRSPLRLGVRLGLHAGPVFVGNVGAGGQFAFRILGDIVNTASRVEGLNKIVATRLLATRDVVADVGGLLLRPLGDFCPKGKQTAVSIVEIVASIAQARDDQWSLCDRFAAALGAFQTGRREDATALFAAILRDYPGDGPARFYLQRCTSRQDADGSQGNRIIRLEHK